MSPALVSFGDGFLIGVLIGLLAIDFGGRELLALTEKVERWIAPKGSC